MHRSLALQVATMSAVLTRKSQPASLAFTDDSAAVKQRACALAGISDPRAAFASLQAAGRLAELQDVLPLSDQVGFRT